MKNSTFLVTLTAAAVSALVAVQAAFAGENHLIQVPEPGTLALIGTGAAVLAARAWWRNRK